MSSLLEAELKNSRNRLDVGRRGEKMIKMTLRFMEREARKTEISLTEINKKEKLEGERGRKEIKSYFGQVNVRR